MDIYRKGNETEEPQALEKKLPRSLRHSSSERRRFNYFV